MFDASPSHQPIGAFVVLSKDRAASLERCVSSYVRNFRRYGRTPRLLVVDDSADAMRPRVQDTLQRLRNSLRYPIEFFAAKHRMHMAQHLRHSGVPDDVVEFGLYGLVKSRPNHGANRNSALLATLDQLVCSVDDDTECVLSRLEDAAGKQSAAVALKAHDNVERVRLLRPHAQLGRLETDVLAAHERLLGLTVDGVIGSSGAMAEQADTKGACIHLNSPQLRSRGRIVLTSSGTTGNSGMQSLRGMLMAIGETRNELLRFNSFALDTPDALTVARGVQRPTISHCGQFMATSFAMDNRATLPPFLAECRNEDGLFGRTLLRCDPHSFVGHIPLLVQHHGHAKTSRPAAVRPVRMWQVIEAASRSWQPAANLDDPVDRIRSLGKHLCELACMPAPECRSRICEQLRVEFASAIGRALRLLYEFEWQPATWARELHRETLIWEAALADDERVAPTDLIPEGASEDIWREAIRILQLHGQLMRWWPDMIATCRNREWTS